MDEDMAYLRKCLEAAPFVPHCHVTGDKNIDAFLSKEEMVAWFCQSPGEEGEPCRDRGFYCRELAMLSRAIQPRTIVEFGTALGISTCLLRWLNPTARLVTVDVSSVAFMPNLPVPIGYLAKHQRIDCTYVLGKSWEYKHDNVDLCFVDADHSYDAVLMDSLCAWLNRSIDHQWAIAWHDYNSRHRGVVQAVNEFCESVGAVLFSQPGSETVWIEGGTTC